MFSKLTINDKQLNNFTIKRGDDYECQLIIYEPNQTGASIQFLAKPSIDQPDSAAVFTKFSPTAVTIAVNGDVLTATWSIPGEETIALEGGTKLIYGVQRVIDGKVKTIEEGSFSIEADVVRYNP
jgi:hypothetical protein